MSTYILPDKVAAELAQLGETAQLCDASGRSLGYFVPVVDPSHYEIIGPEPTDEELAEIEKSTEWYTTAEVLRHLESLQ
jgi:hypothetical protein